MGGRGCPAGFLSTDTTYASQCQGRIDQSLAPDPTSTEKTELAAANRRIAGLEAELAIHRRAGEPFTCPCE